MQLKPFSKWKLALTFKSVDEIHFVCTQMNAIEQYFHVVLSLTLYKVVLSCKSVDETLVCDHSNRSYMYGAVLSCGTVFML